MGDGSGSKWDLPVGWGCVLIEKSSVIRKVFYGGLNDGTVNIAELMAYLAPLTWYLRHCCEADGHSHLTHPRHVHIITDSSYAQSKGEAKAAVIEARNTVLWGAFSLFERQGLRLHWHWVNRETVALNHYVDILSKLARQKFTTGLPVEQMQAAHGLTAQSCNPD